MARRKKDEGRFSVTGPGLEEVSYPEYGQALSRAITAASKRGAPRDGTWYVRDILGDPVAHIENHERVTLIYGRR